MENRLTDVKMLGVNFEIALQKEIKTNCNIQGVKLRLIQVPM